MEKPFSINGKTSHTYLTGASHAGTLLYPELRPTIANYLFERLLGGTMESSPTIFLPPQIQKSLIAELQDEELFVARYELQLLSKEKIRNFGVWLNLQGKMSIL